MLKKISILLILLIMTTSITSYASSGYNFKSGILFDAGSGRVLYKYNEDTVSPIASLTKIMTYYVFRDYIEKNKVSVDKTFIIDRDFKSLGDAASGVGLKKGESVTIKELLNTLFVASANDSAVELEEIYNKDNGNMIEAMNAKAKEIGMTSSKYVNPTGLTDDSGYNVSSAKDLMLLVKSLLNKYPDVLDITKQSKYTFKGKTYRTTNEIIGVLKNADGLKTGYTKEAGYCLIGTELIDGETEKTQQYRPVSIVLGSKSESTRKSDTIKLLSYSKENFVNYKAASVSDKFKKTNEYYKAGYIEGVPSKDILMIKGNNENIDVSIRYNQNLHWDIKKGEKIGTITAENKTSNEIKKCDLIADKNYDGVSFFKRIILNIENLFK